MQLVSRPRPEIILLPIFSFWTCREVVNLYLPGRLRWKSRLPKAREKYFKVLCFLHRIQQRLVICRLPFNGLKGMAFSCPFDSKAIFYIFINIYTIFLEIYMWYIYIFYFGTDRSSNNHRGGKRAPCWISFLEKNRFLLGGDGALPHVNMESKPTASWIPVGFPHQVRCDPSSWFPLSLPISFPIRCYKSQLSIVVSLVTQRPQMKKDYSLL